MKFTEQITADRKFTEYSKPIEKSVIVEMFAPYMLGDFFDMPKETRKIMVESMMNNINDSYIVTRFNKKMNFRIRLFAPGLFQAIWDGSIQMGDGDIKDNK